MSRVPTAVACLKGGVSHSCFSSPFPTCITVSGVTFHPCSLTSWDLAQNLVDRVRQVRQAYQAKVLNPGRIFQQRHGVLSGLEAQQDHVAHPTLEALKLRTTPQAKLPFCWKRPRVV